VTCLVRAFYNFTRAEVSIFFRIVSHRPVCVAGEKDINALSWEFEDAEIG